MKTQKAITLLEFLQLPKNAKVVKAFENGIVLESERMDNETFVLLYLNNFFIEISYSPDLGIVDVTPFKTGYRLEKYIDKYCIDKLL